MFEAAALAFIVSVALVVIGKITVSDHRPKPKAWRHIREHDRVYYMRRGHKNPRGTAA